MLFTRRFGAFPQRSIPSFADLRHPRALAAALLGAALGLTACEAGEVEDEPGADANAIEVTVTAALDDVGATQTDLDAARVLIWLGGASGFPDLPDTVEWVALKTAGIEEFVDQPATPDALIAGADDRLYLAKQAGRDCLVDASGTLRI